MAITDNRTLLTANDTTSPQPDDLSGSAAGNSNTETYIEGDGSYSVKLSSATGGLLHDAGSAQDWSNNTFYIWWNCSTAGKLNTKASGGVRMRFCGATVTDFFEIYLEGGDTYSGGFEMSVVDIERAAANPDNTGGTPPATSAIRYVGIVWDVTAMISGNVDNCFLDAMWRLPASTPGILVEGQNTGSVDWTWADIVAAGDVGDPSKAWGTVFNRDGIVFINTPIRFGANDAVTHGFSDTNVKVQWEDQLVALAGFYVLQPVGGSGTQSFQLGQKTGTGDDAIGTQGGSIGAASSGSRWSFDADDANLDACYLYGVNFDHAEDFQLDSSAVEAISCFFLDCTSARVDNSLFLRNSIVAANTGNGVAFLTTDDLTDVRFCSFVFSDGHAFELTTPRVATQTSKGNLFSGYGADDSNDAAGYNNSGGAVTINVTDNGDGPTIRNGSGASTTVNNAVTLTINVKGEAGNDIEGARVRIQKQSDGSLVTQGTTNTSGVFTDTFDFSSDLDVEIIVRLKGFQNYATTGKITSNGLTTDVTFLTDPTVNLP